MATLVASALRSAMRDLFASADYRAHKAALEEEFENTSVTVFHELRRAADIRGLMLVSRPHEGRFELKPQRAGMVLSDEEYAGLPKAEREHINHATA